MCEKSRSLAISPPATFLTTGELVCSSLCNGGQVRMHLAFLGKRWRKYGTCGFRAIAEGRVLCVNASCTIYSLAPSALVPISHEMRSCAKEFTCLRWKFMFCVAQPSSLLVSFSHLRSDTTELHFLHAGSFSLHCFILTSAC